MRFRGKKIKELMFSLKRACVLLRLEAVFIMMEIDGKLNPALDGCAGFDDLDHNPRCWWNRKQLSIVNFRLFQWSSNSAVMSYKNLLRSDALQRDRWDRGFGP